MRSARKIAMTALLTLAAAGCRHKQTTALVPAQAPSIPTAKPTPPPVGNPLSTQSAPPLPTLPPAVEDASKHAPKPAPVHHRHKAKPAATPATTETAAVPAAAPPVATPAPAQPAQPAQTADNAPAATNPSPIGELSTADVTTSAQTRHDTAELISSTESGLNNIKRALTKPEQETATEIRSFLQKAKAALEADDLDGAHTLATKAKVLLDELTME
jgi:hypothetical protein